MSTPTWIRIWTCTLAVGVLGSTAARADQVPGAVPPPRDAAGVYRIYPGVAPGSESWHWHESVTTLGTRKQETIYNVVTPTLTEFRPNPAKANGTAVIIAPGGGLCFLSAESEGWLVARWLMARGFTAFVLKYRTLRMPDEPAAFAAKVKELLDRDAFSPDPNVRARVRALQVLPATLAIDDGRQAVRYLRAHAHEFKIKPDRIVMVGFSAGGTVVVGAALQPDARSRPDYVGAIYAGIGLVGDGGKLPIPRGAPPFFIAAAGNDPRVGWWQIPFYNELKAAGLSVELHLFASGGHGFGMNVQGTSSDHWIDCFYFWLQAQGLTRTGNR